jgi:hypothetical protein
METERWSTILARIVPQDANDLDALLVRFEPRSGNEGRELFPSDEGVSRAEPALKRADMVCVGLRVTAPLADAAADRALRLVAFAAERDVEVVVLAHAEVTGLERFGFRVERIAGDTPEDRARCEAQILRLWNIDLVF